MAREVRRGLDLPESIREGIARIAAGELEDVEVGPSHDETPAQARERKQTQAAAKSARWRERLPKEYADASLADFDSTIASGLKRALEDPAVRNVVLAGSVGTGKTRAAYAVGRLAVASGLWVEAWTLHDLMRALLPSGEDPDLMEARAKGCDLFVLDDLGATRVSDFAKDALTSIVDARVSNHHKTLVTTNVTETELRAVWEDRLMDRLRDGLVAFHFTGPSRRAPAW